MDAARRADLLKGRTVDAMPQDDEEWEALLLGRAQEWRAHRDSGCPCNVPLLEYLGMTRDEFSEWVAHGTVSDRVRRVWTSRK